MDAKFCGQCGKPLREGAKFCVSCGWKVICPDQEEQSVQEGIQETQQTAQGTLQSQQPQDVQQPVLPPQHVEPSLQTSPLYQNSGTTVSDQQYNQNYSQIGTNQFYNQNYNTVGPSQSYNKNHVDVMGPSIPNPGGPEQNQFKQYSTNLGHDSYNRKSNSLGIGIGIALLLIFIAVGGFFGIRALKRASGNIGSVLKDMPSIGKASDTVADDLNGIWKSEFTPIEVKVNGKSEPAYAAMLGKTSEIQMILDLQSDGKGTAKFQGSSYGYEVKNAAEVQYKKGEIEVTYKDTAQGTSLKYIGTVKKDGDDFKIEGSYETTYETDYVNGKLQMKGKWTASMSKGKVATGADTSKAKRDVTVEQLQGVWKGKMKYAEVKNIDKIPDASEKDKEMFKKLLGMELGCSLEFEGNEIVFTITDPTGGTSDLDELPPIVLQDGVFTAAMKIDDKEGQGKMNIYGVVTEEKENMVISGDLSMSMEFKAGTEVEFLITYSVTK